MGWFLNGILTDGSTPVRPAWGPGRWGQEATKRTAAHEGLREGRGHVRLQPSAAEPSTVCRCLIQLAALALFVSFPPAPRVHPSPPHLLQGSQALGYVAWSYGATLAAQVDKAGRMAVTLGNKPVRQGQPPNLGKLVSVRYPKDSCKRGWCADRLLEITVKPFIKVAITQPWIAGATWGARGAFAPYLQV